VLRALLPQRAYTTEEWFARLLGTQARSERAKRSHLKRCLQRLHEQDTVPWAA